MLSSAAWLYLLVRALQLGSGNWNGDDAFWLRNCPPFSVLFGKSYLIPAFMSCENLPLLFAVWKSWNCLDISWIYLSCMLCLLKPKEFLQLPSGLLLCKVRFIAAPKSSVDTFVVVAMVFFLPRTLASSPIEVGRSTTQVSSIPPKIRVNQKHHEIHLDSKSPRLWAFLSRVIGCFVFSMGFSSPQNFRLSLTVTLVTIRDHQNDLGSPQRHSKRWLWGSFQEGSDVQILRVGQHATPSIPYTSWPRMPHFPQELKNTFLPSMANK